MTTLLACNAFSTKSFTYPIREKTQSNILLSSVTSRIHITDGTRVTYFTCSIHIVTTSLHYLSAPRQDQQLDEDRLVTSDKLRCLDYLGLSYYQRMYTIDPLFWPTTAACLAIDQFRGLQAEKWTLIQINILHHTVPKRHWIVMNCQSLAYDFRFSWKYVDKACIPATRFQQARRCDCINQFKGHTHSPLVQNGSESILIMRETY